MQKYEEKYNILRELCVFLFDLAIMPVRSRRSANFVKAFLFSFFLVCHKKIIKKLLVRAACLLGNWWSKDTSPMSHSTSPGLSDSLFVAPWFIFVCWQCSFHCIEVHSQSRTLSALKMIVWLNETNLMNTIDFQYSLLTPDD